MSGALDLLAVALIVGAALAYALYKSLRAAKTIAKGQTPSCCSDKEGGAGRPERPGRSACLEGSAGEGSPSGVPNGAASPCAGCTGCSGAND